MITTNLASQARPPKRWLSLFLVFLGLFGLLTVNILLSSQLAAVGMALNASQQQSSQLERATSRLRQELVRATALTDLDKQALALGFRPIDEYLTLSTIYPVAYGGPENHSDVP